MEHKIKFLNTRFTINDITLPDNLLNHDIWYKDGEAGVKTTIYVNAGDTVNYKCENDTMITFKIHAKDELQALIDCTK